MNKTKVAQVATIIAAGFFDLLREETPGIKLENTIKLILESPEFENISLMSVEEGDDHFIVSFCGGNNGNPQWETYMKQMTALVRYTDGYVIKLESDLPDDVFYFTLGIMK